MIRRFVGDIGLFFYMRKVAILVDGGFYRKKASFHFGYKSSSERASELIKYCKMHLIERPLFPSKIAGLDRYNDLYRIFYYDCPPIKETVYHPLLKKNINFSKTETYAWMISFLEELKHKRSLALRLGVLANETAHYGLKKEIIKKVFSQELDISKIKEEDFELVLKQKGVDMKIGIDIATIAYKRLANQIVIITGDSDFVPVAKLARREGIDFIIDPMGNKLRSDLIEHVDGIRSYYKAKCFYTKPVDPQT